MDESKKRVPSSAGWVNSSNLPKGPNGRALCRRCSEEVPTGRRSFCGDECVRRWNLDHNPSEQRATIFKRDRGVCRSCGIDTEELKKKWRHLTGHWADYQPDMSAYPFPTIDYTTQDMEAWAKHKKLTTEWETQKTKLIMENKTQRDKDEQEARQLGFTTKHLWEMDHILEVVMGGGGGFNPDNLQTLCIPCHHKKTADLARRRAEARKAQKANISKE